jgi:hypothetical protein
MSVDESARMWIASMSVDESARMWIVAQSAY